MANNPEHFPGFERFDIQASGVSIHGVKGGSGPPVLLLHGYPQTHLIWRHVAPALAKTHTVIATDLRGYGDSDKPPSYPDHMPYSKREMALDQVAVMEQLGFNEFAVVGHDRGGRVAHRMARDHRKRVTKLAVLDIAPTAAMYGQTDQTFATAYYHWFFLIQPAPFPETLIANDVEFYLDTKLRGWGRTKGAMSGDVFAEYARCFGTPEAIHASCEDYRASATIDLDHDHQDDPSLECPVLALWGEIGFVGKTYNVIAQWQAVADTVSGHAVPGGHFVPEEAPDETIAALQTFLVG